MNWESSILPPNISLKPKTDVFVKSAVICSVFFSSVECERETYSHKHTELFVNTFMPTVSVCVGKTKATAKEVLRQILIAAC